MKARFPAPIYDETVLAVNFEHAKSRFLGSLLEIHYAHTLMLHRQGIIRRAEARACLSGLERLERKTVKTRDRSCEDLFFHIEKRLAEQCGAEIAGRMHTARSRNDIDITMYRMVARREILKLTAAVIEVREVLLRLAADNVHTLMPAYTHTQPAQPTTLAHYLMAAVEFLGRDASRLQAVFTTINCSPLGACAITTTGFPIDRRYTARLLGFESLQLNSYGAIAAVDYLTEAAAVVAVCMVNLGRLVQDLLRWCSEEYGFLRLDDAYIERSSIMPQKRNPVALEHTRILASKALGQAQGVLTAVHNTPFEDIVDSEDDLQPLMLSLFDDALRAVRLFAGVMAAAEFRIPRLRQRVYDGPLTATELADTLVRKDGLGFRLAHELVSKAVQAAGSEYTPERLIAALERLAPEVIHRRLRSSRRDWLKALNPKHFVAVREVAGGPAKQHMKEQIERARAELETNRAWLDKKQRVLRNYPRLIRRAAADLSSVRR